MKNPKILIIVLIVVAAGLISGGVVFNSSLISNSNSDRTKGSFTEAPHEYKNIEYSIVIDDYCSCLTFRDGYKFGEYDCDSEPTSMPFSGENYDKYKYDSNSNILVFESPNMQPITADVVRWDSDSLILKVRGSHQDKSCAVNGEDTYEYYATEFTLIGSEMKSFLTKMNKNKIPIEFWDDRGHQNCNVKYEERCHTAKIISTQKILSQINDSINYHLSNFRDKQGKITSVIVRKEDK